MREPAAAGASRIVQLSERGRDAFLVAWSLFVLAAWTAEVAPRARSLARTDGCPRLSVADLRPPADRAPEARPGEHAPARAGRGARPSREGLLILMAAAPAWIFRAGSFPGILALLAVIGLLLEMGGWWALGALPGADTVILLGATLSGAGIALSQVELLGTVLTGSASSQPERPGKAE